MILIDTSAWIEFLRGTGSETCIRVDELLSMDVATCQPVRMEVLAGARNEAHLEDLRRLLARATLLPTQDADYETAAAMYRSCRRAGDTVRRLIDCLIAAVAVGAAVPVLHRDRDFDTLAVHTDLRIDQVS